MTANGLGICDVAEIDFLQLNLVQKFNSNTTVENMFGPLALQHENIK